jgi:predicted AAA+ superfamily ATPase
LDNLKLQEEFSRHPYALKDTIETFLGQTLENYPDRIYVFLDEVQKFPYFAEIVKEYFDLLKHVKFILSGSSILQLSARISESLRGRTISFIVEPFSLIEVIPAVPAVPLEDVSNFDKLKEHYAATLAYQNEILLELNKQFVFGAMPRVFLSKNNEQRQFRLGEYVQILIQRDIIETLRVAKYLDFENMLRLLSFQAGQIVNISTLASQVQLNVVTVRRYLSLAEETFTIERLSPYLSNKRKGLIKDQKVYFRDMGIRNHLCKRDTIDLIRFPDLGHEAENFVHTVLNKLKAHSQIPLSQYFFRSYSKQEVDFVIETNHHLLPIEVKYQGSLTKSDFRNLLTFMDDEGIKTGLVVAKNQFEAYQFNDKKIITLPLWLFSLIA